MTNHKCRKWMAAILACLMVANLLSGLSFSVVAEEAVVDSAAIPSVTAKQGGDPEYSTYAAKAYPSAAGDLPIYEAASRRLVAGDTLTAAVAVPADGSYHLSLTYKSLEKRDAAVSVQVDGTLPFTEAGEVMFPTYWKDGGKTQTDNRGNEFTPDQVMADDVVQGFARDYAGRHEDAYLFSLSAGKHTVTLKVLEGSMEVSKAAFVSVQEAPAYTPNDEVATVPAVKDILPIEGEDAVLKSDKSLISLSDDNSPDVQPNDPKVSKINYIGGTNWSGQNDTIVWKVSVKQAGYYSLGFMYRQSQVIGGISYRHLQIDGKTPFAEAKRVKFKYGTSWSYMQLADDNDPYLFYLTAGEHTISLAVTAGELTDIYKQLRDVTTLMGDLYVDITMVVGETVDPGRSYELFNQIPQFNERLQAASDGLQEIVERLEYLQDKKGGSNVSTLNNAIQTLEKMISNPYSAHRYKSAYYSAYTTLSSLLGTLTNMPLDIDRLFLIGNGATMKDPGASFGKQMLFSVQRFFYSFTSDYRTQAATPGDKEPLNIWINWGRDQAQVLDSMIQSDFARKENITVNVRLVNATIIQAILSGSGPDVMLRMARSEPVNLAMRGALYDMRQFDDYEQVISRFSKNATVPYEYEGGTYALPDTLSFYMMFARTDILSSLGLEVPKTWKEFIHVTTVLQHNNLQVCLPYTQIADSSTVNTGVGGLSLFPTMLLQQGLPMYNADLTASTLTEEPQIEAFNEYTTLYTKYKIPTTMDFYNRFRIGSAPLGISVYTLYTQLEAAAPEIADRWTVTLIPGTEQEDGTINHTSADSGTGCAITNLSKNPENAWKFLKWWTSADVQLKYSDSLESILGPLGRVGSANVEALKGMVWSEEMHKALDDQMAQLGQIPEVPGGYYLSRGVDQAFWNVVEQNVNPTDTLLEWGAIVDAEIDRKRQEYVNR